MRLLALMSLSGGGTHNGACKHYEWGYDPSAALGSQSSPSEVRLISGAANIGEWRESQQ